MDDGTVRTKARPQKKTGKRQKRRINFRQLDLACERFWRERGMKSPGTTHVGIEETSTNN